jgi:hypothetical protein
LKSKLRNFSKCFVLGPYGWSIIYLRKVEGFILGK